MSDFAVLLVCITIWVVSAYLVVALRRKKDLDEEFLKKSKTVSKK